MAWLWIEPLDVLFFRDSRPFAAGEAHWARSLALPTPLPFAGALRSRILAHALPQQGRDLAAWMVFLCGQGGEDGPLADLAARLGGADGYGRFRLRGPFLARRADGAATVFFPPPLDLFRETLLRPLPDAALPARVAVSPPGDGQRPGLVWAQGATGGGLEGWLLSGAGLRAYLRGELPREQDRARLAPAASAQVSEALAGETAEGAKGGLIWRERRVGIALDGERRTARVGLLYMAEVLRLDPTPGPGPVGFLVQAEIEGEKDLPLPETGLLQLGGEGRAARFERLASDPLADLWQVPEAVQQRMSETGRVKLYLASPAVFAQGWLPDFIDPASLTGRIGPNGPVVRLVAAAVGKPLALGGWDMARNRPRAMVRAVPAGSVYYLEALNGEAGAIVQILHGTCQAQALAQDQPRSDQEIPLAELAKIGFGLTLVGTWEYWKEA